MSGRSTFVINSAVGVKGKYFVGVPLRHVGIEQKLDSEIRDVLAEFKANYCRQTSCA